MHCEKKIKNDLYYVGSSDRRLALFENVFPVPRGISYNSYLLIDEKTVLLDTVDRSVSNIFFENIAYVLNGRSLDYLIVNHMEPDHCAEMSSIVARYPNIKIVCNAKIAAMIHRFFDFDIDSHIQLVSESDTLTVGKHTFTFVMAPMVHWPEVMVTYDVTDKILFSADAFGTFGALAGNLYADEVNFERDWLKDARSYYTNIVGKYGVQVQSLLKKASGLEIEMLCPLHGPVWRKNIGWFIGKYSKWSTYTPEENAVMIAYASVYGNTENAAAILASRLADAGIKNIVMYDVSSTHPSEIVSEAFRCSHLVFASTTYNAGIFINMETALLDIAAHNIKNRTVAFIENGSWAPTSGALMRAIIEPLKNMTILDNTVTIASSVKSDTLADIERLADALIESYYANTEKSITSVHERKIEPDAMFKISYGLFVITTKDGTRDNGCIINTVMQITDSPKRIEISVNKSNYTHDIILKNGIFNLSVLTKDVPFKIFEQFGFQSGHDVDKFANCSCDNRSENGLRYVTAYTNAFISGKVISSKDCGTHTVFTADVTEAKILSSDPSVTYEDYFENIKPKPKPSAEDKKGFICKICGYVYEGDTLPADFICPLCKHGAEDFEPR